MTHLSRNELERWRDHGRAEDRERVLTHLAACKPCTDAYGELIRSASGVTTPTHFDPADFVARGYAARRKTTVWSTAFQSWNVWVAALGAAALVVIVVSRGPGPGSESGDAIRGAQIELASPSEMAVAPSVLQWNSGIAAPAFHAALVDPGGVVIFETDMSAPRVTLPDEVRARLLPGRAYTWKISALDRDRRTITSASGTFSIAASK